MKTLVLFFTVCLLLSACAEDPIGQYATDNKPPQAVSNARVSNFPGGATIIYDLPDETDLLYVGTRFTLPNGEKQDIRTSVFSNMITVKGFAQSQKYTLELVAVDRSQNESPPLEVEIEPEDAVIYNVLRSLTYSVTRGGFKVSWENEIQEEIVVTFLKKNEDKYELVDAIYTSEKNAARAIRGQEAAPTTFAVFARDMYNNYTDTIEFQIEPLFEIQLDNKNFLAMPKLADFVLNAWGTSNLSVLWDDVMVAGAVQGQVYYINAHTTITPYFTMDLGAKAKLSRFKTWGRSDYYFRLHHPYDFYLMGTNDLSVAQNSASTDDQWEHLGDFLSHRPSGLPVTEPATGEDYAYAAAGEEFELTEDAPAVRYIRFRVRRSWSGTTAMFLAEIRFWGEPLNN